MKMTNQVSTGVDHVGAVHGEEHVPGPVIKSEQQENDAIVPSTPMS